MDKRDELGEVEESVKHTGEWGKGRECVCGGKRRGIMAVVDMDVVGGNKKKMF